MNPAPYSRHWWCHCTVAAPCPELLAHCAQHTATIALAALNERGIVIPGIWGMPPFHICPVFLDSIVITIFLAELINQALLFSAFGVPLYCCYSCPPSGTSAHIIHRTVMLLPLFLGGSNPALIFPAFVVPVYCCHSIFVGMPAY